MNKQKEPLGALEFYIGREWVGCGTCKFPDFLEIKAVMGYH